MRGRGQAQGGAAGTEPPLTSLRLNLVLDHGVMSGFLPINQTGGRGRGGRGFRGGGGGGQMQNLLLPVSSLTASPGASGLVHRIILTGDGPATLSLGQLALVGETNRITATLRRDSDPTGTDVPTITVKPGRSTTLVADVDAGTSDVNVMWNFNADNSAAFPPAFGPAGATGDFGAAGGWGRGGRGAATPPMGNPGAVAAIRGGVAALGATRGGIAPMGAIQGNPGAMGAMGGTAAMMGPRVDAVGLSTTPNWPNEEQDYRVEVTITDKGRRKAAVKKSILVQVREGN
jgi:hypothetical protein